jgi:hypothetical protein
MSSVRVGWISGRVMRAVLNAQGYNLMTGWFEGRLQAGRPYRPAAAGGNLLG